MTGTRKTAGQGFTFLEVLVAALLLTIVSTAAFASWSLSGRVSMAKRVTEMCAFVGTSEIERLKAETYNALPDSTVYSWYDQQGGYINVAQTSTAPTNAAYAAKTIISTVAPLPATVTTRDLLQLQVTVSTASNVSNTSASVKWTCQTLITFDGI